MIATLTLNPAIDKSTETERLISEKKIRCSSLLTEAGGGGINVSKALHELGEESLALYTCGGLNGTLLKQILDQIPIRNKPITVQANTRESFSVEETAANKQYRFVMPGEKLNADEIENVFQTIHDLENISFLICSGSLPENAPADLFGKIAGIASAKKIKLVVDTSGEPLKLALQQGVFLLKPNLTELCFLAGKDRLDVSEIEMAAMQIIASSKCEILVVSMGSSGAMLVTKKGVQTFHAPFVKKISTVGAGDSMVAGIVWMLEKGEEPEKAVQFGMACGTAATITPGSRLFKKEDCFHLYDWILKQSK